MVAVYSSKITIIQGISIKEFHSETKYYLWPSFKNKFYGYH